MAANAQNSLRSAKDACMRELLSQRRNKAPNPLVTISPSSPSDLSSSTPIIAPIEQHCSLHPSMDLKNEDAEISNLKRQVAELKGTLAAVRLELYMALEPSSLPPSRAEPISLLSDHRFRTLELACERRNRAAMKQLPPTQETHAKKDRSDWELGHARRWKMISTPNPPAKEQHPLFRKRQATAITAKISESVEEAFSQSGSIRPSEVMEDQFLRHHELLQHQQRRRQLKQRMLLRQHRCGVKVPVLPSKGIPASE